MYLPSNSFFVHCMKFNFMSLNIFYINLNLNNYQLYYLEIISILSMQWSHYLLFNFSYFLEVWLVFRFLRKLEYLTQVKLLFFFFLFLFFVLWLKLWIIFFHCNFLCFLIQDLTFIRMSDWRIQLKLKTQMVEVLLNTFFRIPMFLYVDE